MYLTSGITLSLCFYKPMLLIGREFRTLAGAAIGGMALVTISILLVGWEASVGYLQTLFNLSQITSGAENVFRYLKLVDFLSISRLLLETDNSHSLILAAMPALILMPLLFRTWWTIDSVDEERRDLIRTSTISGTLILSLQVRSPLSRLESI